MDIKGFATIAGKITNPMSIVAVGKIEDLEGKLLTVIDRNEGGDIMAYSDSGAVASIMASDVFQFVPVVKFNGIIMPAEHSFQEKAIWTAKAHEVGLKVFNARFIACAIFRQKIIKDLSWLKDMSMDETLLSNELLKNM